jgi:hypothetical protein
MLCRLQNLPLLFVAVLLAAGCPSAAGKPPGPKSLFGGGDDEAEAVGRAQAKVRAELEAPSKSGGRCSGWLRPKGNLSVVGRVLMPKGDVPIANVNVRLIKLSGAEAASGLTDGCGRFLLTAPEAGSYTLKAAVRSFKAEAEFLVDGMNPAKETLRVEPTGLQIGVVDGEGGPDEVLLGALGLRYTKLPIARLPWTKLSKYDILMVSGKDQPASKVVEKLRGFVQHGGALFLTGISLAFAAEAWPGKLTPADGRSVTSSVDATPVDKALAAYLGSGPVKLSFGGTAWTGLQAVDGQARVLLAAEKKPHMVLLPLGRGVVAFSTFHYTPDTSERMLSALSFMLSRL